MAKQANLKFDHNVPMYKFAYQLPRDYEGALKLDTKNGNTK